MQKFFIHFQGQQLGPFSLEELKQKGITRNTMVWFDGLSEWKEAKDVYELADLFRNQPPPFEKNTTHSNSTSESTTNKEIQGNNGSSWFIWSLVIICVIIVGLLIFIDQQKKQDKISRQLSEQQEQIDVHNAERAAEQERLEKEARQSELARLKHNYDVAINNLRLAKIKLDEVQEFQFLRTLEEKEQQISAQLEVVRKWENEVLERKSMLENF
jgi:cytoskeletal protein RodZ